MNEMRKLMEAVAPLFEVGQVGFKNIKVSSDPEDMSVGGKPHTVMTIWIYDNSYDLENPLQGHFSELQSSIGEEEYEAILKDVLLKVKLEIEEAKKETSLGWHAGEEPRFEYFAIGAGIDKSIDSRLLKDIIDRLGLSDTLVSKNDNNDFFVFKIDRPMMKRWWNKR